MVDRANKLIDTTSGFEIFAQQKARNRTRRRHLAGLGDRGGEASPAAGGKVPGEAMPPSRQAGLRALSVGRPCALRGLIFNQAPVAGRNGIFLNKNSLPLDWM